MGYISDRGHTLHFALRFYANAVIVGMSEHFGGDKSMPSLLNLTHMNFRSPTGNPSRVHSPDSVPFV